MVDDLLRIILDHLDSEASRPIIVSGSVGAGKTQLSQKVVTRLAERGRRPGGVLSPRVMNSGETLGYDVVDLLTKDRRSFARLNPPGKNVGKYFIRPEVLKFANRSINRAIERPGPVFVDEVGRLELSGGGLSPSVNSLVDSETQGVYLVRIEFLSRVRDSFGISVFDEVRVEDMSD